jgi:hypothetical protein
LLIGAAARQAVRGLMFLKHYDQSLKFARAGIDRLEPERGSGSPAYLSLYGMLFLAGSATAAYAHRSALAYAFLDKAHGVARQLGYDGNEYFTGFGPTNVHLYRLSARREFGDGAGVLSAARQVSMDDLSRLPRERRGAYYLNLAWGHSLVGHPDDAISTLLTTASLLPDEIRCRPIAIDLIDSLRRSGSGTRSWQLEQLAARAGLTDQD